MLRQSGVENRTPPPGPPPPLPPPPSPSGSSTGEKDRVRLMIRYNTLATMKPISGEPLTPEEERELAALRRILKINVEEGRSVELREKEAAMATTKCECGIVLVEVLLSATKEAAKWGWASAMDDILYTLETGVPSMEDKVVAGTNSDCDTGLDSKTFIRLLRSGTSDEKRDAAVGFFLTLLESAASYLEHCNSVSTGEKVVP